MYFSPNKLIEILYISYKERRLQVLHCRVVVLLASGVTVTCYCLSIRHSEQLGLYFDARHGAHIKTNQAKIAARFVVLGPSVLVPGAAFGAKIERVFKRHFDGGGIAGRLRGQFDSDLTRLSRMFVPSRLGGVAYCRASRAAVCSIPAWLHFPYVNR